MVHKIETWTWILLALFITGACGGGGGNSDSDGSDDGAGDPDTAVDGDALPDSSPDGLPDVLPDTTPDVPDDVEREDGPPIEGIFPPHRVIDWDPGVRGGIPDVSVVCPSDAPSVRDFGAVGDGSTDDAPAFAAAVEAAPQGSAVRVPEGTYLLRSALTIDKGVVLCGEGPDRSRLHFDCGANAVSIVTYQRGDYVSITSGYTKGSTRLTVSDASGFTVGEYAEMKQTNDWDIMDPEDVWRHDAWAPEDCVGQMFRVAAVEGSDIVVEPPVHMDYDGAFDPVVRPMGLVDGAGLQGLYFRRVSDLDYATIEIKNAANSWVRDCVSEDTSVSHVIMSSAIWCEVRDSYFHHAYDYGGGGHGYGVDLGNHVTACLTENNIFVHLRHSMLVQVGATGNVFGYNYSIDPFQSEGGDWTPTDISLHGHYPNMNLFEGNTVQEIDVSDYWGPCGPGNTFFRNVVEAEGIQVMDYSHGQNAVGNELGTDPNVISVEDTVTDTLIHGNWVDGAVSWDPAIDQHELPVSLYHDARPAFFGDAAWPVTGADLAPGSGPIPAETRYADM
jgi:hypothetical protein